MDPWFFPYKDDSGTIALKNTPILTIKTESWYDWCSKDFDCKKAMETFFKECENNRN